jgi:hypothetical protein
LHPKSNTFSSRYNLFSNKICIFNHYMFKFLTLLNIFIPNSMNFRPNMIIAYIKFAILNWNFTFYAKFQYISVQIWSFSHKCCNLNYCISDFLPSLANFHIDFVIVIIKTRIFTFSNQFFTQMLQFKLLHIRFSTFSNKFFTQMLQFKLLHIRFSATSNQFFTQILQF